MKGALTSFRVRMLSWMGLGSPTTVFVSLGRGKSQTDTEAENALSSSQQGEGPFQEPQGKEPGRFLSICCRLARVSAFEAEVG